MRGVFVGCVLVGGAALPSAASAAPSATTVKQAAKAHGRSEAEIRRILADRTTRVHDSGRIYFVDPVPKALPAARAPAKGPYPYAQTFTLHSRPGSNRVIYLDFDGETISGTAWNDNPAFGTPSSFYAEPFSLDATPGSFSNAEQDIVQSVWQRVAEDFAPFDVDVTTQDPGAAAIDRSGPGDTVFGTRALITDATEIRNTCACGGIAFLGVFDDPNRHALAQPAWVFPESLSDSAKNIAEATSHEVGHNFDLDHDGTSAVTYYEGHGSWAPIMGVGYYRPIVQWSRGEYSGANNSEDDLATIVANGAGVIADDAGDTTAAALNKGNGPSIGHVGLITTDADVDVFKITAGAGASTFTVTPAPNSPNLDAQLKLLNSAGAVLATNNPVSATSSTDVATGLGATISFNLPSAGTYYVAVDGVGALSPLNTGYSGYASLGRYTLSGTFSQPQQQPDSLSDNGTLYAAGSEYLQSADGRYRLFMQNDGNLVLYYAATLHALWNSGTAGSAASHVAMQADGNLVIYSTSGQPLWWSGTAGNPHARLVVQNDGNLVIYRTSGQPIWWTGTQGQT